MSWIVLTQALIQGRMSAPEYSAFTSAAIQVSQTPDQILADEINRVTKEVRGYVGSSGKVALGAEGTIPDELEAASLTLLRRNLATRLPRMKSLFDETRQRELSDAMTLLRDVAAYRFRVIADTVEATDQPAGGAVKLVSSRPRVATPRKLRGL
jgi:hypothetical protein